MGPSKKLFHHANTQAPHVAGKRGGIVGHRHIGGNVVAGVGPGDGVHRQGGVLYGANHGAGVVKAPGQRRKPSAANPAVGGFQSHDSAQGGGNTNAAAGVAAHRDGALAGGGGRTAAAAGNRR